MQAQAILFLCFFSVALFANINPQQIEDKFSKANQLFSKAQSQQEYLEAAALYEEIAQTGISNGYLFYNIGNSYLKAGQLGYAIVYYHRAKELLQSKELLRNLSFARSLVKEKYLFSPPEQSKVAQYVFFWHFSWPDSLRWYLFLIGYFGFWLLLLLKTGFRVPIGTLLLVPFALLIVFMGSSIGIEKWQQHTQPLAVLVGEDITVRQGKGYGYDSLYETQLGGGVEVRVVSEEQKWFKIQLPDQRLGWVEAIRVKKVYP